MHEPNQLIDFVTAAVRALGGDEHQGRAFARALVWSDTVGRSDHGLWRLATYLRRLQAGLIRCPCRPCTLADLGAVVLVDGDAGFGQFVAKHAMQMAIGRARRHGIGVSLVRNSNHLGAAGYFAAQAAEQGMLGLALSNSVAKVAPFGGRRPLFGTNPLAFACPRDGRPPLLVDMATSAVSGAAVIRLLQRGESLPAGVAVGADGREVTTAEGFAGGALLPFGGHKGAGIALLVELLTGVLSGGALSTGVGSMFNDFSRTGDNAHCLIAIASEGLLPPGELEKRLEALLASMQQAVPEVRVPGERRWRIRERSLSEGIALDEALWTELQGIAEQLGITLPAAVAAH